MSLRIPLYLALATLVPASFPSAAAFPSFQTEQELPSEGHSELGGIILRLVAPSDAPAPRHIHVTLSRPSGAVLLSRNLSGGHLELQGIEPGDYFLQIDVSGYQTVNRFVHRSEFVGANLFLNVQLKPERRADYPASGLKPVVDADTLQIPNKALRQLEKAMRASDAGRMEKALGHLSQAIRIYPEFHQAYNNRGALHLRMQDFPKAEKDLRQALQIRPRSPNALRNLSWLLVAERRYQEASELLRELSELQPQDAWPQTFLGESLFQLQRFQEAESPFRKALQLDPAAYVASYRLGAICLHFGDKQGALGYWKQFLRTNQGIEDPSIGERVRQLEREQY